MSIDQEVKDLVLCNLKIKHRVPSRYCARLCHEGTASSSADVNDEPISLPIPNVLRSFNAGTVLCIFSDTHSWTLNRESTKTMGNQMLILKADIKDMQYFSITTAVLQRKITSNITSQCELNLEQVWTVSHTSVAHFNVDHFISFFVGFHRYSTENRYVC